MRDKSKVILKPRASGHRAPGPVEPAPGPASSSAPGPTSSSSGDPAKGPVEPRENWFYVPVRPYDSGHDAPPCGQIGYGRKEAQFTAHCWWNDKRHGAKCHDNHACHVPHALPRLLAWLWRGEGCATRAIHQRYKSPKSDTALTEEEVAVARACIDELASADPNWAFLTSCES